MDRAVPDPAAPGPGGASLKPVALDFAGPAPGSVVGGMAVGPKADLVWTDAAVYLMAEKGKLRPLWRVPGGGKIGWGRYSSVSFDGKFAWVACERNGADPLLAVIDPSGGKAWDVSKADGLPRPPAPAGGEVFRGQSALVACATEPGRAVLSGWFAGRSCVGVAAFDPATGAAAVTRGGLCDMHGNVREWCENEYDDATYRRVVRGGAHQRACYRARSACRLGIEPFLASNDTGLRLCFRPDE